MNEIFYDFKISLKENRLKLFCMYLITLLFVPVNMIILNGRHNNTVTMSIFTRIVLEVIFIPACIYIISSKDKRKKLTDFFKKNILYLFLIIVITAVISYIYSYTANYFFTNMQIEYSNSVDSYFKINLFLYSSLAILNFIKIFFVYSFTLYGLLLINDKEKTDDAENKFSFLTIWRFFSKHFSKKVLFFALFISDFVVSSFANLFNYIFILYGNYGEKPLTLNSGIIDTFINFLSTGSQSQVARMFMTGITLILLIAFLNSCVKMAPENKNKIDEFLEKKNFKFYGTLCGYALSLFVPILMILNFILVYFNSIIYFGRYSQIYPVIVIISIIIVVGILLFTVLSYKLYFKFLHIETPAFTFGKFIKLFLVLVINTIFICSIAYFTTFIYEKIDDFPPAFLPIPFLLLKNILFLKNIIDFCCITFMCFQNIELIGCENIKLYKNPLIIVKKFCSPIMLCLFAIISVYYPEEITEMPTIDCIIIGCMTTYILLYLVDFYMENRKRLN